MTRRVKIWSIAIAAFLVFAIAVWFLGRLLALQGADLWILRGVLWLSGVIVTAVLVWYFLKKAKGAPETPAPVRDDIDTLFATARTRLASGKFAQKATMGTAPIVLWMGLDRSGKTTAVARSGLEPELLAGEVLQGDAVVGTRAINLWLCANAIFLEAGGKVVADASRWTRLIRHLQPRRLAAVFARGTQAPRVAVVCLSCEDLVKAGGAEAVQATAAALRTRLAEVSQRLGVRLPVYVLFTKMDQLPHFADYARHLSREEARDVLGATLPWMPVPASTYAERVFERVNQTLERIFHSLAARRLQFLPREMQADARALAYEFPREFRKIAPLAAQFLVDLCRPSQQSVNPFLRGFYFSGVRAIIVDEQAAAPAAAPSSARAGATQLFQSGPTAKPVVTATSRKVPEWTFLGKPIRDVILRDKVAMDLTAGGTRINLVRRMLLASAASLALIFALGLFVSYVGNRRLERGALADIAGLAGATFNPPDLPPIETLRRLEALRVRAEVLGNNERRGAPLRLRWGLYSGSALYPAVRTVYFREFDRLMLGPTGNAMLAAMQGLPSGPNQGSEYQAVYDLLKGYLIIASYPDRSTPEFLPPVLLRYWQQSRKVEPERLDLAQAQFAFYSRELRFGNPYEMTTDSTAIGHTRTFLRQFTGSERIYQFMLAEAAKQQTGIQFNRTYPGSGAVLTNAYEVPGAFTKPGWDFMQNAFKNDVDRFFVGEGWVLGDQGPSTQERAKVVEELRSRYRDDYFRQWRTFLTSARFAGYGSITDAAQKMAVLAGNQSPLLQMFSLASQNTAVDSLAAATSFQPVQVLTPPGAKDKLIGESNQGYMGALVSLQAALEQVAGAPAGADGAVAKANSEAGNAKVAARQIAQKFSADPGSVGPAVQQLMLAPLTGVEALLGGLGASGFNRRARDFCRPLQQMLTQTPFRPGATSQASITDVSSQFQRGTGALWSFYADPLQRYLVQQGSRYAPKSGSDLTLSSGFVEFFNRGAAFSDALYPQDAPGPRLAFTFKPLLSELITSVVLSIDGRTATFSRTSAAAQPFVWIGNEARDARATVRVGGNDVTVSQQGTWAVFRLFQAAQNWRVEGIVQRAQWTTRHEGAVVPIPFELNLGGAPAVFDPMYFSGASCSGDIAR